METIVLKLYRQWVMICLQLLVFGLLVTSVLVFAGGDYRHPGLLKILTSAFALCLAISLARFAKNLKHSNVTLVLTSETITLEDQDTSYTYRWQAIQRTSLFAGKTFACLTVETAYDEQSISIAWPGQSPVKIKELIDQYRQRAA